MASRGIAVVAVASMASALVWGAGVAGPRIEGSSLCLEGRPVYLAGVWIGASVSVTPRLYKPDMDGSNPAYSSPLSAATAPLLGIDSAHPPMSPLRIARQTGWFTERPQDQVRWDELQAFVAGCGDLPLVVDCAGTRAFDNPLVPSDLKQVGPGWHGFVPLCPEHPQGRAIYEDYWRDCARQIVAAGANAFAYELFNEPAYNCRCDYNKREFARRMQQRYDDIGRANRVWEAGFTDFEQVAQMQQPHETAGLWCDWIKFIGDRYVELLAAGRQAISGVDLRRPLYFVDQPSIGHTYLRCNGIDPVKVNALMDIVGVEGGISFGTRASADEGDPMAEVLAGRGRFAHQLYLDMARAFDKPVINTETYCGRFFEGVRFPSHRADIVTELWEEMIHGASASYFYNWGRRWWEWSDLEGAKKSAREVSYKAFSMLNPYAYPPEALEGFRDFQRDMRLVGADLLAGPRIRGQVALLISQPTLRQLFREKPYTERGPYEDILRDWYAALLREQIPVDVVWEEQLGVMEAGRYRAVLAPGAQYCYRETQPALQGLIEGGTPLIASSGAFARDEYGNPWRLDEAGAPAGMPLKAHLLEEGTRGPQLQAELRGILLSEGDFRPFRLAPADDASRPLVCEAYQIRRPGADYFYMVNWQTASRLVRLCPAEGFRGSVLLPLESAALSQGPGPEEGALVHLPAQERVLVLATEDDRRLQAAEAEWSENDIRARYRQALRQEKAELAAAQGELARDRSSAQARHVVFSGPVGDTGEYLPDEDTVLLMHLNGTLVPEPSRVTGRVEFVPGKLGSGAVRFGPQAVAQFTLPPSFDKDACSIELWARPDWPAADGKRHALVELKGPGPWNQNTLMLYKNLNYEFTFAIYDDKEHCLAVRVPINILRRDQWTHLCATWDSSEGLRFYVDGELRGTAEGELVLDRFDTLSLGSNGSGSRPWVGAVDEVRISRGRREPQ